MNTPLVEAIKNFLYDNSYIINYIETDTPWLPQIGTLFNAPILEFNGMFKMIGRAPTTKSYHFKVTDSNRKLEYSTYNSSNELPIIEKMIKIYIVKNANNPTLYAFWNNNLLPITSENIKSIVVFYDLNQATFWIL